MLQAVDSHPLVSICIPTYNGADWIEDCINSALNQTYAPVEIVVVDDCSTDNTVDLVRSIRDERIRLSINQANQGLVGNWNECVRQAKGEYIKFLFQDDTFYPQCVDKMMQVFVAHPQLGMVFARREFVVDETAPPELARELLEHYSDLHLNFDGVQHVNDGRRLFAQHLEKNFTLSCVAEPPSTLIRREVFQHIGLFNIRMRQTCDIEMWLRIMFYYDVGFVDEELLTFRIHGKSASALNRAGNLAKYDRFWMLEGLLSHPEIERENIGMKSWRDNVFSHYRNSLVRPRAGWRSITTREGFGEALKDAREMPSRIRLFREAGKFRKGRSLLHPRLD
jgi:glycosyltransferase involved in cell wall biosynthesis